jgi:hypothetical protein
MVNTQNDWIGAAAVSAGSLILIGSFLLATSNLTEELPIAWARLFAFRFLIALVLWALTIFSNRRKLGTRTCFELGALLLIAAWVFSLGRILSDVRVAPTLVTLKLGSLSSAMFLSGAGIAVIALNMAVRLIRLHVSSEGR